ncbi:beta-1,4-glucuronyltransferase 1 isoform X2 [Cephus cinctus]|uniref:Beta-1,4-glucuronyltransferase 1 n=1 Tax=Cephus cinctus TaxID=211228 RepID=A0AAJ7W6N5_CEPCN|nr:beta-1,4-glucuronyltransferase 1 isoform X2 [Cephus cinctus]
MIAESSCESLHNELLGCRPWNLSLVSVIILAFSNMLLTFFLLQSENCRSGDVSHPLEANLFTEWNLGSFAQDVPTSRPCSVRSYQTVPDEEDTLMIDIRRGRWDARRLFKTFDAVLTGSGFSSLSESHLVSLATQSSVEKLHSIVQVAHHWTGPISVALYAAGDEEFDVLQKYLVYLRKCYPPIRDRVLFSLLMPKDRMPTKQPRRYELPEDVDCVKPEATLQQLVSRISSQQTAWRVQNTYPQNHLRNLARKNCQTDYVFLTDVDIVPSFNLTQGLNEFLKSANCDKCAYVIPTYELDTRVRFPYNKSELVRIAEKGLARPFHQKVFIHNQFATNFTRWVQDVKPGNKGYAYVNKGKVYVCHDVTNFEFLYEPFYVAKDIAPSHDERFMGYGYTRNTQVYEMYVAGYQFKVLSPIFTGHWGLQTKKGRPAWREKQNNFNRKHFDVFKKEVFARYMRDPLKMVKKSR